MVKYYQKVEIKHDKCINKYIKHISNSSVNFVYHLFV